MKTIWHCYNISPIDFNWEYLPTVKQTLCNLVETPGYWCGNEGEDLDADWIGTFLSSWKFAKETARIKLHWDGEFTGHPRVIWVPEDNVFAYGFVFKHGSNGTTSVISPQPMDWLLPLASDYSKVEQSLKVDS